MRSYINLVQDLFERLDEFNVEQFLSRARAVMELVRRGANEHERAAAKLAFERLMERAKQEVARMRKPDSGVTGNEIDRFLRALHNIGDDIKQPPPKEPPPRPAEPRFKVGQWVVHVDDSSAGKIIDTHQVKRQNGEWEYQYRVDLNGARRSLGQKEWYSERYLRRATQDEIDAATAKRAKSTKRETAVKIIYMAHYFAPEENSNKVYGVIDNQGSIYTFWGGMNKALKVKPYPFEADTYVQFKGKVRRGYREMAPDQISRVEPWVQRALATEFHRRAKAGL